MQARKSSTMAPAPRADHREQRARLHSRTALRCCPTPPVRATPRKPCVSPDWHAKCATPTSSRSKSNTRPSTLAGQRRNHPSHRNAGQGRLRGHALHVPGPDCGPSAGGGRCRCRYAARFVDRLQYGLRMRDFIEIIIANAHVPVIIDAGIGRPSQPAMRWRWVRMR